MAREYRVDYTKRADRALAKMDSHERGLILSWIDKKLEGCENPRAYGKRLTGGRISQWRYRVQDYRIIAEIRDQEILILVLDIGHRREVYQNPR